jgi:GPH family glycoside/pentoside/hexuronide:cation symporter
VLADPFSRRLLLLALVNATPVAITSTLFLFFVESRLQAPGAEGPLLLLFFLAAALSTPLWMRAALRFGPKRALLAGMVLAILSFAGAATMGAGDVLPFALICMASGAALGADLTLLPAIFARRMEDVSPGAGAGFGLWSFVSKLTLAFAAVGLLPLLEARGFVSGGDNPASALWLLTVLYALVPCALKLAAIALLAATKIPEADR